jgi:hypothetical protein
MTRPTILVTSFVLGTAICIPSLAQSEELPGVMWGAGGQGGIGGRLGPWVGRGDANASPKADTKAAG